ncbi:MAG: ATP-binding protein [Anaerolineales bacterium]
MATYHAYILTADEKMGTAARELVPPDYTVSVHSTPPVIERGSIESDDRLVLFVDSALFAEADLQPSLEMLFPQASTVLLLSHTEDWSHINPILPEMEVLAVLSPPFPQPEQVQIVADALQVDRRRPNLHQMRRALAEANRALNQRLQELNVIYTVGNFIASSLQIEELLSRIVEVSINLTRAEEGFIFLREGEQLFLRTAKNMEDEVAQRLHLEAHDQNAWRVINSGRPLMLRRPVRLVTGYLVRAMLYVPLNSPREGTAGVLAVVNRQRDVGFTEGQLFALSSLADFAATVLENARLFSEMEAERRRIRTILEQAKEAVLITDTENRLILWSQTAAELFDIPPDAEGLEVAQVIGHEALVDLFKETAEGANHPHTEIALSEEQVFNAQLSTIDGLGRVVVMQDITHLKTLDRLKSEFVSTVSHDLRTPLTTVQGYVELLDRAGPLNEMQRRFIDKTMRSLNHITDLITDLLDIGRIEAGYDLEMHPLRLSALIQEVGETLTSQAEDAEVILEWVQPDDPLWVLGNRRRLRQVLQNLVGNAIKYNQPGGWVRIDALQDEEYILVSVSDNGIGIPPQEQPHIFERFYRVQSQETQNIQGTGLGLAIVKSVIEKHKGRVWVKSTLGAGSTFTFILPACAPPPAEGEEPECTPLPAE